MNRALGPILILVGMVLLDLIRLPMKGWAVSLKLQQKAAQMGALGALFLGVLFALSFCPLSAALFFGSLIPLAVKLESSIVIPSVFAFATGLPVIVLSLVLVYSVSRIGKGMHKIKLFELWMRRVVASIFILIGGYMTLAMFV